MSLNDKPFGRRKSLGRLPKSKDQTQIKLIETKEQAEFLTFAQDSAYQCVGEMTSLPTKIRVDVRKTVLDCFEQAEKAFSAANVRALNNRVISVVLELKADAVLNEDLISLLDYQPYYFSRNIKPERFQTKLNQALFAYQGTKQRRRQEFFALAALLNESRVIRLVDDRVVAKKDGSSVVALQITPWSVTPNNRRAFIYFCNLLSEVDPSSEFKFIVQSESGSAEFKEVKDLG